MSAEAWGNLLLFIVGLVGLIGIFGAWPVQLFWIILLAVGWGILVIYNADGISWD
jgi:hypothetical protein